MKKLIIVFILGILLFSLPYLFYAFVTPPFYGLRSRDFEGAFEKFIEPRSSEEIWPTKVEKEILRFDVGFSLNIFYINSTQPVSVTVYVDRDPIYKEEGVTSVVNLNFTENFDRFGGWKLGLETPLHHGPEIYIKVENGGDIRARVIAYYKGVGYYREGNVVNFILVLFGLIMALGSVLQSLTAYIRARAEKKLRETVEGAL